MSKAPIPGLKKPLLWRILNRIKMARPKLQKMTTKEAFKHLLDDKAIYKALPPGKQTTFRVYRKRLNDGIKLSIKNMERLLDENGYQVHQPKLWIKK